MRTLSLQKKILAGIAMALCAVILGFAIHTVVVIVNAFKPETPVVDTTEYEFTFEGNIKLNDVDYDVKMKGLDGKFSVDANKIEGVTDGSYTFTEGQGWTFAFNDANGTIVRSQFDNASKTFGFIYHLNLGSRGEGNLRLSFEDKNFTVSGTPWNDIPSFTGTAGWFGGGVKSNVTIICDADGNFSVKDSQNYVTPYGGTYVFENNCYVFTAETGETYTATKNADGLYSFELKVVNALLASYGPAAQTTATMTEIVLTVD